MRLDWLSLLLLACRSGGWDVQAGSICGDSACSQPKSNHPSSLVNSAPSSLPSPVKSVERVSSNPLDSAMHFQPSRLSHSTSYGPIIASLAVLDEEKGQVKVNQDDIHVKESDETGQNRLFTARLPLPAVLECLSNDSGNQRTCLEYWSTQLSDSHLSPIQRFAILIAMKYDQSLAFGYTPSSSASSSAEEADAFNRFTYYLNSLLNSTQLAASFQFMGMLEMINLPPLRNEAFHLHVTPGFIKIQWNFAKASHYWLASYTSVPSDVNSKALDVFTSAVNILTHQLRQAVSENLLKILVYPVRSPFILQFIKKFYQFSSDSLLMRQSNYATFVKLASSLIKEGRSLDEVAVMAHYPTQNEISTSPVICRIMDQYIAPRVAWDLAIAVIQARRLDILTSMIQDEGFVWLSRSFDICPDQSSSHTNLEEPERLRMLGFNFLHRFVRELLVNRVRHVSWTSHTDALSLILENGGTKLLYRGFVTDCARLNDAEVMRYLTTLFKVSASSK